MHETQDKEVALGAIVDERLEIGVEEHVRVLREAEQKAGAYGENLFPALRRDAPPTSSFESVISCR